MEMQVPFAYTVNTGIDTQNFSVSVGHHWEPIVYVYINGVSTAFNVIADLLHGIQTFAADMPSIVSDTDKPFLMCSYLEQAKRARILHSHFGRELSNAEHNYKAEQERDELAKKAGFSPDHMERRVHSSLMDMYRYNYEQVAVYKLLYLDNDDKSSRRFPLTTFWGADTEIKCRPLVVFRPVW